MEFERSSAAEAGQQMSDLGHRIASAAYDVSPDVAKNAAAHISGASQLIAKSAKAHIGNDHAGASMYLRQVADGLTSGAKILAAAGSEDPEVLNVAHLGKAYGIHQNYVDAINEGKRNGS